jgi:ribosomal protein S24E
MVDKATKAVNSSTILEAISKMVSMQKAAVIVMLIPPYFGGRSIHDMEAL